MTRDHDQPPLIGRPGLLAAALRGPSIVVTGGPGAGRTRTLQATAAVHASKGAAIFAAQATLDRSPLSYLVGFAAAAEYPPDLLTVWPQLGLPAIIEGLAAHLLAASGDRRIFLFLDDLQAADSQSLAALPLLRRRLQAEVLAAARTWRRGCHPRPLVAAALDRLDISTRLHLNPLHPLDTAQLIRVCGGRPRPAERAQMAATLGAGHDHPGLVLGLWAHSGHEQLPAAHGLVQEFLAAPHGWAQVLARPDVIDRSDAAVAAEQAEAIDQLALHGWLLPQGQSWIPAVPALARSLADALMAPGPRAVAALVPAPISRSQRTADRVLTLVGHGLTNAQIATKIELSEKSVEGYVTRLLRDYDCRNRTQLAAKLLQLSAASP